MNIWVNGCFDILHTGHINLLWFAKLYGTDEDNITPVHQQNKLIVGLDTDTRVKKSKGDKRPINDLTTRITMMRNLRMVDEVVVFDSDDELRNHIKDFKIDYVIVGDHYKDKEVIGAENAKHGAIFYTTDEHSTTNIIDKIKNLEKGYNLNLVSFDIGYCNEIIKMLAYSYDIQTNKIMFGVYSSIPNFYEIDVLEYIKPKFAGGVALDIGANIGNHSLYFSKFIFDKVFAFEANINNYNVLLENKKNNNIGDDKLITYNVALSDGNKKYQSCEAGNNMGGCRVIEGDGEMMTKKLDEFDLPKVDFIKIDVEGHELKVLKGAINLIKRDFPDIVVECDMYNESSFELIDLFMKKLKYRVIQNFREYNMFYYRHK